MSPVRRRLWLLALAAALAVIAIALFIPIPRDPAGITVDSRGNIIMQK
jgi:hypothetical protein